MNEAILNANKVKTAYEIAEELHNKTLRIAEEEAAALLKEHDDEVRERTARKAALNSKWGTPSKPPAHHDTPSKVCTTSETPDKAPIIRSFSTPMK
jgi:hypothetical protein